MGLGTDLTFRNYRNALNKLIRAAKVQYFKLKINDVKSDAKTLCYVLLTIIRKKEKTENLPTHFQVGSTQINDPDLIADKCNDFSAALHQSWMLTFPNLTLTLRLT